MAGQRNHTWYLQRVAGTGTREPKADSKFRGLAPKSMQWRLSINKVLLIPGASNEILRDNQELAYIWEKPTSERD